VSKQTHRQRLDILCSTEFQVSKQSDLSPIERTSLVRRAAYLSADFIFVCNDHLRD